MSTHHTGEGVHNLWNTLAYFKTANDEEIGYYSLPALEKQGIGPVSTLPLTIRIVLESLLRNCDGKTIVEEDVKSLANWNAEHPADKEIPFKVSRVLMQDFTGVPAVVDLAAMRDAMSLLGKDPLMIQPQVPVNLIIDHSVQVDSFGTGESFIINRNMEFKRNSERYSLLKWGAAALEGFDVMPPGLGICHQVNLEYLAKCVGVKVVDGHKVAHPDTLVGTDSHTTMVNGIGVFGFGVGGIEAEAAVLNQPVALSQPEVVGVHITNAPREGVTATDIVLTLTQLLRTSNVVGKFVEFYGPGIERLSLPDRATMTNMCPEYGATVALFPVDDVTLDYLKFTGRSEESIDIVRRYYEAQGFSSIDYSKVKFSSVIEFDLGEVRPSVAGPKLPQSRMELSTVAENFRREFLVNAQTGASPGNSFSSEGAPDNVVHLQKQSRIKEVGKSVEIENPHGGRGTISDGDVAIAAITSCTNTSNPEVMIAAGLLAKKAVEKGLTVSERVKTSLAPGSRVVTDYLQRSKLMDPLEKLGFYLVGYGCTTCIGNSGPLPDHISKAVTQNKLVVASVLSGNRNFEARIHGDVRANYLMSPPLVVAYAIAGSVLRDLSTEPLQTVGGSEVFLKDIWPTKEEVMKVIGSSITPEMYRRRYSDLAQANEEWNSLQAPGGKQYAWDENSTYIQSPPFFEGFDPNAEGRIESIRNATVLAVFGDSVTTDHISPAGAFSPDTPAGAYLIEKGVSPSEFNTYGSRRGNDRVMARGTFANKRIKNLLLPGVEGGFTLHFPDRTKMTIFDAAVKYGEEKRPLVVFAGSEYGTGSSRDWAAKGPKLLGVRAVVANSFERIHRSNLIGMGILPLQFLQGDSAQKLGIDFSRELSIEIPRAPRPREKVRMTYVTSQGGSANVDLLLRLDNDMELEYCRAGGILQYVMKRLLS